RKGDPAPIASLVAGGEKHAPANGRSRRAFAPRSRRGTTRLPPAREDGFFEGRFVLLSFRERRVRLRWRQFAGELASANLGGIVARRSGCAVLERASRCALVITFSRFHFLIPFQCKLSAPTELSALWRALIGRARVGAARGPRRDAALRGMVGVRRRRHLLAKAFSGLMPVSLRVTPRLSCYPISFHNIRAELNRVLAFNVGDKLAR